MLLRLLPWFWLLRLWLLWLLLLRPLPLELPVNAVLSSFLTSGGRLSSLASAASSLGAAAPRRARSQPHRPRRPWHLHMLHVASRCNRSICLYQNIKMKRRRFHSSIRSLHLPLPCLSCWRLIQLSVDKQSCQRCCCRGKARETPALASPPGKVRQN